MARLFLLESLWLRAFAARTSDYGATLTVTVRAWHRDEVPRLRAWSASTWSAEHLARDRQPWEQARTGATRHALEPPGAVQTGTGK